jgi:hypothetical protein
MCQFRRKVLNEALKEDDTRAVIESISGPRADLKQMTCDAVTMLFNSASNEVQRANSKRATVRDGVNYNGMPGNANMQTTVQTINAANKAFWEKQTGVRH